MRVKCDLFFDATFGDAFSDIYGVGWNIKTDLIKQLVLKSGTPLILMPQTYGPFSHKYMEKWAVQIINRARLVYTRDDLSAQFIKSHCTADVTLTTDLAFKLPFAPAPKGMGIKKRQMLSGKERKSMIPKIVITIIFGSIMTV